LENYVERDSFGSAEKLVGEVLLDKWEVVKRIRHDDGISGSTRSACYQAQSSAGELAFIKAFDFRREELAGDTEHLERMVREFNYEKNAHIYCVENKITRVTRIFGADKIIISGEAVHYLVCEWAEKSLREHQPPGNNSIPWSNRFTALRNIASALSQMHKAKMAHQDIKPSNAVCFNDGELKLTDLGSSSCELLTPAPHDLESMVGQPNYAPYELVYEHPPSKWENRRLGCDVFLMGNICFTSLVGGSLSHFVLHAIPEEYRPNNYTGDYAQVLPFLITEHTDLVPMILKEVLPPEFSNDVIKLILSLCHPDPTKRGHTRNIEQNYNQYSLERVISQLNRLATKARVLNRGK
jgi:serine/threonine protein kinase